MDQRNENHSQNNAFYSEHWDYDVTA